MAGKLPPHGGEGDSLASTIDRLKGALHRYRELEVAVSDMRAHQRDFFKTKSRTALVLAQSAERRVDAILASQRGRL